MFAEKMLPSSKKIRPRLQIPQILSYPDLLISPSLANIDGQILSTAKLQCKSSWQRVNRVFDKILDSCDFDRFPFVADELSAYTRCASPPDVEYLRERGREEYSIAETIRWNSVTDTWSLEEFVDLIKDINVRVAGGSGDIRVKPVLANSSGSSAVVVFPSHHRCKSLIESLFCFLKENIDSYPAISATVALVALIHAHPFPDGNGRTARVLFNSLLSSRCNSSHYLPIVPIGHMSRGGYILKLRRAMIGGEWEPLCRFILDALRLSGLLQQRKSAV